MKTKPHLILRLCFSVFVAVAALFSTAHAQSSDPQLNTWITSTSRSYARVWQSAAAKTANTTSTTWPTGGTRNGGQTTPS